MSWVAVAVAGAAVVGGVVSSNASSKASKTQANAARDANNTQLAMYDQTREDQTPWREAGSSALKDLLYGTGLSNEAGNSGLGQGELNKKFTLADFEQDPGYQFRLNEGTKALQASAAARGGLNSGATLKALTRYGQDYGASEYDKAYNRFNNDQSARFNRLSSIAGIGQTANNTMANAGANYANNVSQNQMAAGNAQAAGMVGQANAFNNGMSQVVNYYTNQQLMNSLKSPTTGG